MPKHNGGVRIARYQLGRFDRQCCSHVVVAHRVHKVLLVELRENLLAQRIRHLIQRQRRIALHCDRVDVHEVIEEATDECQFLGLVWLLLRCCLGDLDS